MTENRDQPNLDDVIEPSEQPHPDHRAHAKTPKHLDEEELTQRLALERDEVQAGENPPPMGGDDDILSGHYGETS